MIEYTDKISRQKKQLALSMAEIGTTQGFSRLQGKGIAIYAGRRKRELLADYLQTQGATTTYTITNKAGWHDNTFILPSGEIIAPEQQTKNTPKLFYAGNTSKANDYTHSGSLKEWQDNVVQYARNNPLLILAIGTSLAAPLLAKVNEYSGGFHLFGQSSTGKTILAYIALSV